MKHSDPWLELEALLGIVGRVTKRGVEFSLERNLHFLNTNHGELLKMIDENSPNNIVVHD